MAKQIIARPKCDGVLVINNGLEWRIRLNPNQKWEVTIFDKKKVSVVCGFVDLLIDKSLFEERFCIITEEVEG